MTDIPNLTDDKWEEQLERLTHYALMKFRKCGWQRGRADRVEWAAPGGNSPADIAMEAIFRVLSRIRKYDQAAYRDFHDFLRSVVDSLVSHLVEKAVGHKTDRMPMMSDKETGELVEVEVKNTDPGPCDICICRESVELVRNVVRAEDDPLVLQLLECLEAGITKPADMAEYLEVKVKDVYNAQRRFRRKLDQAFAAEKERQQ